MNISIGNDHAGTDYKFAILKHLEAKGIIVTNYETNTNNSVDYPDFVHPIAEDIENKKSNREQAMTPVKKHKGSWCRNCDANLVHAGQKCDLCGAKPERKLLKKETNAR